MMKLYWRYKKDGKWTWKAATNLQEWLEKETPVDDWMEEEE